MSRVNPVTRDDQRIAQLIEAAKQAQATGRGDDAARLMRQAELEAPRHPLVLNEMGRRMLFSSDFAGAYEMFSHAVREEPSYASIWINLAASLRGLGRSDEEMTAIEKVLSIEPLNLRALLQKASLQEIQGNTRASAVTYRIVLQALPPAVEPPAWMTPMLVHARNVVETNNSNLEGFLEQRLTDLRGRFQNQPLRRFDRCLATLLQKQQIYRQQPSFMFFPHLPSIEFHERSDFPWLDAIEAATDDIREELVNVLTDGQKVLEPYVSHSRGGKSLERKWGELQQSRRWGVYFLWSEGVAYPEHLAKCPRTVAALEGWPGWDVPRCGSTAVFSVLDAHTRIPAHTGVNNTRLVVHVPLIVPPGCGFRVGAEQRQWEPGKAFVFDDTIEHEAWNDSDEPRAVLILDTWNPGLSMAEREMVRTAIDGVNDYYGFSMQQGI